MEPRKPLFFFKGRTAIVTVAIIIAGCGFFVLGWHFYNIELIFYCLFLCIWSIWMFFINFDPKYIYYVRGDGYYYRNKKYSYLAGDHYLQNEISPDDLIDFREILSIAIVPVARIEGDMDDLEQYFLDIRTKDKKVLLVRDIERFVAHFTKAVGCAAIKLPEEGTLATIFGEDKLSFVSLLGKYSPLRLTIWEKSDFKSSL